MKLLPFSSSPALRPLFDGWPECLLDAYFDGRFGKAWIADDADEAAPAAALVIVGAFGFLAGKPDASLVRPFPNEYADPFLIYAPRTEDWFPVMEQAWGEQAKRYERYAIQKEPDVFDRALLQSYVAALPPQYKLRRIDEGLYTFFKDQFWSRDFCSQYPAYADYAAKGMGVAALLQDGTPIAGASSYVSFHKGIEIEIHTLDEHRRKGVALACAAQLMLDCLDKGLYPSWDASNMGSVKLAEKLGYHYAHPYTAYFVMPKED